MSTSEVKHLMKMVNQIAVNVKPGSTEVEAKEKLLKHVDLFWSTAMKQKVALHADENRSELDPIAFSALQDLQDQYV